MVRGQRTHRLPQRLDYTLIPAPLDLTLPLVDEKSPLPAIIVTPSSPRSMTDFSIAFLAPAPKPTLRQRLRNLFTSRQSSPIELPITPVKFSFSLSAPSKPRAIVILFIMFIVLACHLITHRMAIHRPHMDFEELGHSLAVDSAPEMGALHMHNNPAPETKFLGGFFQFLEAEEDGKHLHDFIVTETLEQSKAE